MLISLHVFIRMRFSYKDFGFENFLKSLLEGENPTKRK